MNFMRKSVYLPFLIHTWPLPQANELGGCQNAWMRAAADVSMEKNKTSISYTKSKKEVDGDILYFCVCIFSVKSVYKLWES